MSEPSDLPGLYRAIGRIEGQQKNIDGQNKQIIDKLNAIIVDAFNHMQDDKRDFAQIRELIDKRVEKERDESDADRAGQDTVIADLCERVAALEKQNAKEQGIGVVVLALLAALASGIGTIVLSLFTGHITVKWS